MKSGDGESAWIASFRYAACAMTKNGNHHGATEKTEKMSLRRRKQSTLANPSNLLWNQVMVNRRGLLHSA
ncbi:MAG TPA: hypothetical protein DCZ08_12800, partial [Anaerolineaceae bacterium]|nr:hypothetical protein [Anaerolineaceae bacterium]